MREAVKLTLGHSDETLPMMSRARTPPLQHRGSLSPPSHNRPGEFFLGFWTKESQRFIGGDRH